MNEAKLIIEVQAGIIPEQPLEEYRRRYALTSEAWHETENKSALLAELNGQATGYATLLMLQPDALNWVRTDWLWL